MEEDLEMFGNQLVTSTSIFTVGYVIGQIPFNLLMPRLSPRWIIPSVCPFYSGTFLSFLFLTLVLARGWLGRGRDVHVQCQVLSCSLRPSLSCWDFRVSIHTHRKHIKCHSLELG